MLEVAFNYASEPTIVDILESDEMFVERIIQEIKACAKNESMVLTLLRVLEDAILVSANANPELIKTNFPDWSDLWNELLRLYGGFSAKVNEKVESIQEMIRSEFKIEFNSNFKC